MNQQNFLFLIQTETVCLFWKIKNIVCFLWNLKTFITKKLNTQTMSLTSPLCKNFIFNVRCSVAKGLNRWRQKKLSRRLKTESYSIKWGVILIYNTSSIVFQSFLCFKIAFEVQIRLESLMRCLVCWQLSAGPLTCWGWTRSSWPRSWRTAPWSSGARRSPLRWPWNRPVVLWSHTSSIIMLRCIWLADLFRMSSFNLQPTSTQLHL